MINYQGLSIESVEENRITFLLCSHNVMNLTIFFEAGTGYKGGDKIEVQMENQGCTIWEGDTHQNKYQELRRVRVAFDGYSESEMATTIFALTAMVLTYRRDGISMQQIGTILKNRIGPFQN